MTKEEKLLKVIELQNKLLEQNKTKQVEKDEYDLIIEKLESELKQSNQLIEEASKEIEQKDAEIKTLVETNTNTDEDILNQIDALIKTS